jgi:hypothetical protein
MAYPFTRYVTFIANSLPKLTAAWLNATQDALAAAAYPAYGRLRVTAYSTDYANVYITLIEPYMALDSVTSQYVGMPAITNAGPINGFTIGQWNYIYLRVVNSIVTYAVSTTAPEATLRYKTGDETYRYVCSVNYQVGIVQPFHLSNGRYTLLQSVGFTGITSPTWLGLNLNAWVPPTSRRVQLQVTNYSSGNYILCVRPTGTAATLTTGNTKHAVTGKAAYMEMMTNSLQQVDYCSFGTSGTNSGGDVLVDGYTETE